MRKKVVYIGFLVVAVIVLLELLLRATGVCQVYSERIVGRYITHYNKEYENWYPTWANDHKDTFTLDHGEFRHLYHLNSLGLREREADISDSAEIRIFVFGDSFTEGVGTAYDSTWPRILEDLLLADGYDVSLYNFGMSGNDPFNNFVLLRDKFLKFKPTHVLFTVNDSDFSEFLLRGGFDRFKPDGTLQTRSAPRFHVFYKHSHVARGLAHLAGFDSNLTNRLFKKRNNRIAYEHLSVAFDSTAQLTAHEGIGFMVVVQYSPGEIIYSTPGKTHLDQFVRDSQSYRVAWVGPEFYTEVNDIGIEKLYWPVDGHFNAHGYDLLARHIYRKILTDHPDFF